MPDGTPLKTDAAASGATSAAEILGGVRRVIRQLSHSVRNHLNTAELETALAAEISSDPEVHECLTRARQAFAHVTHELENLLARLNDPLPEPVEVSGEEVLEALRWDAETHGHAGMPIDWHLAPGGQRTERWRLDLTLLCQVVRELLDNAVRFKDATSEGLQVRIEEGPQRLKVELVEPKRNAPELDGWGARPFAGSDPRRYGLGLWAARRWVSAMGGRLEHEYDAGEKRLFTRIVLPNDSSSPAGDTRS